MGSQKLFMPICGVTKILHAKMWGHKKCFFGVTKRTRDFNLCQNLLCYVVINGVSRHRRMKYNVLIQFWQNFFGISLCLPCWFRHKLSLVAEDKQEMEMSKIFCLLNGKKGFNFAVSSLCLWRQSKAWFHEASTRTFIWANSFVCAV